MKQTVHMSIRDETHQVALIKLNEIYMTIYNDIFHRLEIATILQIRHDCFYRIYRSIILSVTLLSLVPSLAQEAEWALLHVEGQYPFHDGLAIFYDVESKALRDAQREMKNIRMKASRSGVSITPSKWESAIVNF